eukprot:gene16709-22977_t
MTKAERELAEGSDEPHMKCAGSCREAEGPEQNPEPSREAAEKLKAQNETRRLEISGASSVLAAHRTQTLTRQFPTLLRYQSLTHAHVGAMLLREQKLKLKQLLDILPLRVTGISSGVGSAVQVSICDLKLPESVSVPLNGWQQPEVHPAHHRMKLKMDADGYTVDRESGVLLVLDDVPPASVLTCVDQLSAEAHAVAQAKRADASRVQTLAKKADASRVQTLVDQARRQLRLRRLLKDPTLPLEHVERACRELIKQSNALAIHVEGSSVRIAFASQVCLHEAVLDLAWDFTS